jgi:hypothetical protein
MNKKALIVGILVGVALLAVVMRLPFVPEGVKGTVRKVVGA